MNKLLQLFFIISALAGNAQTAEDRQILDIEVRRDEAIASHDKTFLTGLYDDQFHGVTALGKVINKQELIEILDTNNPHVTFSTEDMKVTLHGPTAVLTGKLVSKSKSTATVLGQTRFIHIYIKREGSWKILEAQATVVH